jgi:hypothetical protein
MTVAGQVEMMDWAVLLYHAAAIASGSGYLYAKEQAHELRRRLKAQARGTPSPPAPAVIPAVTPEGPEEEEEDYEDANHYNHEVWPFAAVAASAVGCRTESLGVHQSWRSTVSSVRADAVGEAVSSKCVSTQPGPITTPPMDPR